MLPPYVKTVNICTGKEVEQKSYDSWFMANWTTTALTYPIVYNISDGPLTLKASTLYLRPPSSVDIRYTSIPCVTYQGFWTRRIVEDHESGDFWIAIFHNSNEIYGVLYSGRFAGQHFQSYLLPGGVHKYADDQQYLDNTFHGAFGLFNQPSMRMFYRENIKKVNHQTTMSSDHSIGTF